MKTTFLSLIAIANAVVVTETDWNTFYVTVGSDGQSSTAPSTTEQAQQQLYTTSSSFSTHSTYNYAFQSTWSAETSPEPTTSSSSSITSSSSTPAAVTTSSSSTTPVTTSSSSTPETTSSSSTPVTTSSSTPVTTSSSTPVSTSSSTPVTTSSTTPTPASTTSSKVVTTSSSQPPQPTLDSFQSDIVNYHNRVRAEHQVGSMTWNSGLASYAQQYLDNSNCVFAHSGGPYGENIAIGYDTIDAAQDAWYNEEDLYDYAAGQFGESTGHFTQMVWKGSNEIGCATVDCSGRTFLACEYYPRGNIIGEFTENVFPKSS